MSSVVSERRGRFWMAGLQSILLKYQTSFGRWKRGVELNRHQLVAHIADELAETMEIWVVDAGLQTKANIACWHRLIQTYRGYLLCSDTAGHTFLIDMPTHTYIKGSAKYLLQIDGVDQAKRFVDELCRRLQVDGGALFN